MAQSGRQPQSRFNTLLIVLVGQMGCLTVLVIALAVAAGFWLDGAFHTKPIITLVLLLGSVPVSILLMLLVGRRTLERFRLQNEAAAAKEKESLEGGGTLGRD